VQTKTQSLLESVLNILVGAVVAFSSQYVIFPMVGIEEISFATHLEITAWFTLISVARSYIIRRYFNGLHLRRS